MLNEPLFLGIHLRSDCTADGSGIQRICLVPLVLGRLPMQVPEYSLFVCELNLAWSCPNLPRAANPILESLLGIGTVLWIWMSSRID